MQLWSGRLDSNQRPPAPKAGALTKLRYAPNGDGIRPWYAPAPLPALSCQSRHASQEPVKPTGTYDGLGFISCTSRAKACKTSGRRHFVARLPAQSAPHWRQERPSTRHAIRTGMLTRHEKRETKWRVVAGGGLEPPDLQGMNLASYQLLHPANKKYSAMWMKKRDASRRLHKPDTNAPDGENGIRQLMWAFEECSG